MHTAAKGPLVQNFLFQLTLLLCFSALAARPAHAQAGISTGSIQGTILDAHGGTIPQAKVTITSKSTDAKSTPEVTGTGTYNSGPLPPGDYVIRVEAQGFRALEEAVSVQVGN